MPEIVGDTDLELNIDATVDAIAGDTGITPEPETDPVLDGGTPAPAAAPLKGAPAAPIAYPKSWKKDYEAHWPKIPRELQEYVTNTREKEYLDGLEQYKTGHNQWGEFNQLLGPYMPRMNSLNIQPKEAIKTLLNVDYTLAHGTPEQKTAMLSQMAKHYGIDLKGLADGIEQKPFRTEAEAALERQFAGMNSTMQNFINAQMAEKRAAVDKDVTTFFTDPKHPLANEVADDILLLIQANKGISLADAYEKAVWANPVTRAKEQARLSKETSERDRKAREEAARKARQTTAANTRGVQVDKTHGAPAASMDDTIRDTLAEINARG